MGRKKGSKNKMTPDERWGFSQGHIDECWEWQKGKNDKGYGQFAPSEV